MLYFRRYRRCTGGQLLILIFLLLLTACGGGSSSTSNTGASLSRIEITPNQPSLAKGSGLSLVATGIYSDNSTRVLNDEVTWQTSNINIATFSTSGDLSAIEVGLVSLQASLDGVIGNTELTVTNATLSRLELNPGSAQLAKSSALPLTLVAHYSDGNTQDATEQASWLVTDSSIATLSNPIISGNLWVTGVAVGSTQVSATLGSVSAQMDVDVTTARLVQLIINPVAAELALGTGLELTAQGLYSDGSNQILTQQVSWSSADTGILTIDGAGHIQPQSVGNTIVTAALAGITGSQSVTVNDAILTTIELGTAANTIPLGSHQALFALGHYSDGSLQDITEQVVWQSTPAERIAISNADGSRGLATALAIGAVTATASLGDITGSLALNITAATLSSIDVFPLNARLAMGTQQGFHATGHYSDGSIQEISEHASWATADTSIALTSNVIGNRGQALALSQGNTTVSAMLDGITGSATLEVTAAQLLSINITPPEPILPAGTLQTISAEGNFSDGSVQNLDNKVTWESDNRSVAVVNNGVLTALQPGSARISASWSGISGHTTTSVSNATLSSLQIIPSNPNLAIGTDTQLQATGLYSDGSLEDVTTQVTWNSADDTRLRAENRESNHGRLTALAMGDVIVTASLDGVQISTTLSVGAATLTGLSILANSNSLDSAEQQPLTAMGTFSDGSSQDLTSQVIWNSSAPSLAQVSNTDTDRGLVVAGIGVSGSAVITASFGGFNPTLTLNINDTPQRPISLVVLATPNAILNDNSDASSLEIRVQAANPTASVADGTIIDLQISQSGIPLSTQSLTTTGGVASTSFTTTNTGLLQIHATVNGTNISNSAALYASSNITAVITGAAFADAETAGTQILNGARFGFLIHNISNRNFPLVRYELRNGADILASTTNPLDLNNNVLTGGLQLGLIVTLNFGDFTDQGIEARYYLTDPATGAPFFYRVTFTSP